MLFVRVGKYHVNMETIKVFEHVNGRLLVWDGSVTPFIVEDPDKTEYKKLCESIGVRPVEG